MEDGFRDGKESVTTILLFKSVDSENTLKVIDL